MSSEQAMKGISRQGLDAAFEAEETRKSDLILQASLLREQGDEESSSVKFAEAAIEERLRDQCLAQGLAPKSLVHAFSAAGCWARAGNFHHSLNTAWVASRQRWIRLDARGNKPGVDAQFSLGEERLAFAVRPEVGEVDYGVNHAAPHPAVTRALGAHEDCRVVYARGLPTGL